ncbi:predicted protein [Nematostella vectensis]|uniref:Uncharacterized protein n=1 Tax=Nematostella vectensis TaxID=45351 RepID=A7RMF5_NEMVE|nr:predicted protein [Nematostella vectensis]|eukprot:XP_001639326.1 predicted protein [Nematostella vectensis]
MERKQTLKEEFNRLYYDIIKKKHQEHEGLFRGKSLHVSSSPSSEKLLLTSQSVKRNGENVLQHKGKIELRRTNKEKKENLRDIIDQMYLNTSFSTTGSKKDKCRNKCQPRKTPGVFLKRTLQVCSKCRTKKPRSLLWIVERMDYRTLKTTTKINCDQKHAMKLRKRKRSYHFTETGSDRLFCVQNTSKPAKLAIMETGSGQPLSRMESFVPFFAKQKSHCGGAWKAIVEEN